jgi:hypothetical protein
LINRLLLEDTRMTENQAPNAAVAVGTEPAATSGSRGTQALVGAAIAIVGVLAGVNPESVFLRALHQAMPQIADAIPALITACGAVIAAFSEPPRAGRR